MDQVKHDIIADIIIGIDPGASGGIAIWRPEAVTKTLKIPKTIHDMMKLLKYYNEIGKVLVFIEKQQLQPRDKDGIQYRMMGLLEQYKQLKDAMEVVGMPYVPVHPMSWQSYLKLRVKGEEKKDRKNRYKEAAQYYYPETKATLWNCDALLLVEFGRRKRLREPEWIKALLPADVYMNLLF